MKNVLYGVDENNGTQIDITSVSVLNTVVAQVSDVDGNDYPGDQVTLITDRDFCMCLTSTSHSRLVMKFI